MKTIRPIFRIPCSLSLGLRGMVLAGGLFVALLPSFAIGQSSVAGEMFSFRNGIVNDGTTVVGPPHRGFFGSMPTTFSYDSKSGWADMAMPTVAYHFKPWLSADMALPYYLYMNATQYSAKGFLYESGHDFVLSDMIFAGHYNRTFDLFDCTVTGSTSAPIGDKPLGVSTGRMTGGVNGHFDRQFGNLSADMDLGFGDSSELVRESSRKNYTSLGNLGFAQVGSSLTLQRSMNVEAHAYEQVPMGTQTVLTTVSRKNGEPTVLHNSSAADDYGVTTRLDLPLTQKMGLSANYSYSIPLQDTSVGVSLTLILYKPIERY